jgi:SAM-dependent methyltransferase
MIDKILKYQPKKKNLWNGSYKIPWDDGAFSQRMLKMHLSQEHDMASRRDVIIEKQVQWIDSTLLKNKQSKILDIGCGPGLYVNKLTTLGYLCKGIDFSPASIEHARETCDKASFVLGDIREVDCGEGFDLVMFLFGELNVFSPEECRRILEKVRCSLKPGGILLLEVHCFDTVRKMGEAPKSWFRSGGIKTESNHWFDNVMDDGLFSDNPHIALIENNWLENEKIALSNFWVLEDRKDVAHYISTTQAYTDDEYTQLLEDVGFVNIENKQNCGVPIMDYQVLTATQVA